MGETTTVTCLAVGRPARSVQPPDRLGTLQKVVATAFVSCLVAVSDAYGTFDLADLECTPVIGTPEKALAVDLLVS